MRRSRLAFAAGILVNVAATDAAAMQERGDPQWWVWVLVGSGLVLAVGTVWIVMLGRRGSPVRLDDYPAPSGRVSVVLKTVPLQPAGGKTPPISPVATDARGTVYQLPPTGLAAWLVVYRDGIPSETLVLQTIGVTTIGRDSSSSICLEDKAISKRHATITATVGRFVLEDSTDPKPQNPTKVDGKLLDGPIELRDNMRLQIGSSLLLFKCTI